MKIFRAVISVVWVFVVLLLHSHGQTASLTPPEGAIDIDGRPVAIMKSLDQVEPRLIITSLPFVINSPGSYYLANSLPGVANSNGITIISSDVQLDLNGFSLIGVQQSLNAIEVMGPHQNISIRNGVVRQWGGFGVLATGATDVVMMDVNASTNGAGGLYSGKNSYLERCGAFQNGMNAGAPPPPPSPPRTDGIQVGPFSTVIACKSSGNKGAGIHGYDYARIVGCTATRSAEADGIHVENYCTVRDCVVAENAVNGIKVGSMSRVTGNTAGNNGLKSENKGAGVLVAGSNSLVEDNLSCYNDYGISMEGLPYGSLMVRNYAINNRDQNYYMSAGQYYGPHGELTPGQLSENANPWMNFNINNN